MERLTKQELREELEKANEAYWDAQKALSDAALARAAIMNLLMEED